MITALVTVVVLSPLAIAYVIGVGLLARLVQLWEGRDVMAGLRPDRKKIAAAERRIDDIHYETVIGS